MANTVKLTINALPIECSAGTSVFEAAAKHGIFIPNYCYHPDLSVAGVCRMCMVDIEKNPRLQISCNTPVAEGMVVRTNTDKVKETVKSTLELHLINHPLDCPICDKAGECKLQDFYSDYGLYESRMRYEKVHKPKVVDIGSIVLDSERCILCTRCVRFTSEVTKTHELGIFNRGDRSELKTYDDGPLRNEYTGNLADICPVGALTAKDFRFRCRVWFLEKTDSVCAQCAHGCNTTVSVNPATSTLYRVEPRRNPEVNKSWICDYGRWDYHYAYSETRLKVPHVRKDGARVELSWHEIYRELKEEISSDPGRVLVALSTQLTNEELVDCIQTFSALGDISFTRIVDESVVDDKKPYDGVLKHRDLTPNAEGFERVFAALRQKWLRAKDVSQLLKSGQFKRLLCLGLEGDKLPGLAALLANVGKETKVAIHASNRHELLEICDLWLPNVSSFEKSGTFVNADGRLQRVSSSLPPQHISRGAHAVCHGISQGNDRSQVPANRARDLFESVVGPKILKVETAKWRGFEPMGISAGAT